MVENFKRYCKMKGFGELGGGIPASPPVLNKEEKI